MSKTGKQKAFTLIELLIVISIISILAGLVFTASSGSGDKVKRVNTLTRCNQIRDAILAYWEDCRTMPLDDPAGEPGAFGSGESNWVYQLQREGKSPPYLDGLDANFIELSDTTGEIFDDWGNPIHFRVVGQIGTQADYLRAPALLNRAFFVWSDGPDGIDDFTDLYEPEWNVNVGAGSDDWENFDKIIDPPNYAIDNDIDDVVSGN